MFVPLVTTQTIARMLVQVVRTQMDQEAEIMKQSMARQEAAQAAAAEETEKEEDSAEPLRTVSSGARGACFLISRSLLLKQQKEADSSLLLLHITVTIPACPMLAAESA